MTQVHQQAASELSSRADNGILARVPGEFIGQASNLLPNPATTLAEEMAVEVDAGWLGRVRLTFKKHRYRRPKGKFSATVWSCRHADVVGPA